MSGCFVHISFADPQLLNIHMIAAPAPVCGRHHISFRIPARFWHSSDHQNLALVEVIDDIWCSRREFSTDLCLLDNLVLVLRLHDSGLWPRSCCPETNNSIWHFKLILSDLTLAAKRLARKKCVSGSESQIATASWRRRRAESTWPSLYKSAPKLVSTKSLYCMGASFKARL